jgi:hypothetical protein
MTGMPLGLLFILNLLDILSLDSIQVNGELRAQATLLLE